MKTYSLSCNNCGAPLDVPEGKRLITCSYCNARLEVKQEGGTVWTDLLGHVAETTNRIESTVRQIQAHSELAHLDAQWQAVRAQEAMGWNGPTVSNAGVSCFILLLTAAAFGVWFWGIATSNHLIVAIGLALLCLLLVLLTLAKVLSHRRRKRQYEARRKRLAAGLRTARGRGGR